MTNKVKILVASFKDRTAGTAFDTLLELLQRKGFWAVAGLGILAFIGTQVASLGA
jgi:hypothetical protein